MKKILFVFLASAFAFAACEEINETYADPAEQLEVTTSNVVFNAAGGSRTVLVTSNVDWTYSADDTWYDVERGDGELVISAEDNTTGANRYSTITVASETLSETISVSQVAASLEGIDLSADESANCYIAATGTSYRFNATVKGNGAATDVGGVGVYEQQYGVSIDPDDIIYADLLWEAAFDADKTRSRNIIDGWPVYSDGYVYFTTGSAEGNALIAVKDADGTILWSWHIWVTDSDIELIEGNEHYWMDRNLGANSTDTLDVNNRGLLYQWGRKDPFLPSYAAYGADDANLLNTEVGLGSGTWVYSGYKTKLVSEAPGNIPLSIENPMTVLLVNGTVYSWYLTSANDDLYYSYLWGDSSNLATYVKSIFDPCPPGYTVPVSNPWISGKDVNVNYWSTTSEYGRYWLGGNNAYYPCAGFFNGSTGAVANTGTYGYCWTSGMASETSSSSTYLSRELYFTKATIISYTSSYPVHALSVRCMKAE